MAGRLAPGRGPRAQQLLRRFTVIRAILSSAFMGLLIASAPALAKEDIVGHWDLNVGEAPDTYPSWIGVAKEGDKPRVQFMWRSSGLVAPEDAKVDGDTVTFTAYNHAWKATAKGDALTGTATDKKNTPVKLVGKRFVSKPDVSGKWTLTGPQANSSITLALTQKGDVVTGSYKAKKEMPINEAKIQEGTLSFTVPTGKGGAVVKYAAKVKGDVMEGEVTGSNGKTHPFSARRERQWADPIELFNGKNMDGWKVLGEKKASKWEVVDGILRTPVRGANIVTDRKFGDFKLHVEFNVPEHGNSGVYLRGRYEIQVEDSYGKPVNGQMCGAIYTRIIPKVNASKKPGEWQAFDVTLIGEYVTVALNGQTIIENEKIEGITGGAIDSDEAAPGPIYLQGDHTPIQYRKVTLTPVKTAAAK
jgi:hypothetical protein